MLRALILALAALMLMAPRPVHAITLLRDADIEHGLKQLAAPILRAAGLSSNRVKILLVDDNTLNAFVVSQDAIFINSGLVLRLQSAGQLQGVIAHEAAHIVNGHLTRRLTNLQAARNRAALGVALALVVAASGSGEAAAGLALGTNSAAQRAFLKHTRAEEASADQSAVRYMRSAGVSPTALAEVMQIFRGQEALSARSQDPYVRSHPLSRDRFRAISAYAATAKPTTPSTDAAYWFARMKGKLEAHKFPRQTLRKAGKARYADVRAIMEALANHEQSRTKKALAAVDRAIKARPKDPFLHDLKGEILMESRNFQAAANSYARAVQLAPRDALILAGHGRALLATGQIGKAKAALERSNAIDYRDGTMLRDLSVAYAKSGQRGMAALVTAERYALRGRMKDAGIHAKRATDLLPAGSGPWQRAQDVLIAVERFSNRRN